MQLPPLRTTPWLLLRWVIDVQPADVSLATASMSGHVSSVLESACEQFSYQPRSGDLQFHTVSTLDKRYLATNIPLDNWRHHVDPTADIGLLSGLPVEVLDKILIQLTLRTLTDFRRVNQRAMQLVDAVSEYQTVLKHSPDALRAILATGAGRFISCAQLIDVLRTALCEDCQDFGGYIYLLTCKRVCFLCLTHKEKYLPLTAMMSRRTYGYKPSDNSGIPRLLRLPNRCFRNDHPSRTYYYDRESVRQAGERYRGSAAAVSHYVAARHSRNVAAFNGKMAHRTPIQRLRSTRPSSPIPEPLTPEVIAALDQLAGVFPEWFDPVCFFAVVRAPWLDPLTKLSDWGFNCIGCKEECQTHGLECQARRGVRPNRQWRRKYSKYTFGDHVKDFGAIEDGCCHPNASMLRWHKVQKDLRSGVHL